MSRTVTAQPAAEKFVYMKGSVIWTKNIPMGIPVTASKILEAVIAKSIACAKIREAVKMELLAVWKTRRLCAIVPLVLQETFVKTVL